MSSEIGNDDVVIYLEGGLVQDVKVGRRTVVTQIDFDLSEIDPEQDDAYCAGCGLSTTPHYHSVWEETAS